MNDEINYINKWLRVDSSDAYLKVVSKASRFRDYTRLYIPYTPYYKLKVSLESTYKTQGRETPSKKPKSDLENLIRSLRRSKKTLRELVLCNSFDMFITFTFKSDRDDVIKCKRKMTTWIQNQKYRYGNFHYLIVPEFHKDGKAIHFHALVQGYKGNIVEAINPKNNEPLIQHGRQVYTLKSYKLGFSNLKKIDDESESRAKVGTYIGKYITKDMPIFPGKKRFWSSKGLKRPLIIDNPKISLKKNIPFRMFNNQYGITYDFTNSEFEKCL